MRRGTILVGLAVAAAATPAVAGAAARPTYLPSRCADQVVRPAQVTPCHQNRRQLVDLRWSRWGRPRATATGTLSTNTCVPDCPSGAGRMDRVRVTADRLRHCRNGTRQYTRLRYEPVVAGAVPARVAALPCP